MCVFSIFTSSCSLNSDVKESLPGKDENAFQRIAVVPFQRIILEDTTDKTVRCPISGRIFMTCDPPEGVETEKVIEEIFIRRLEDCRRFAIIPPGRVGGIYKRISTASLKSAQLEILREVGRELEADGVVTGYVYRYREREGYPYSVKKPASVAFGIYLVRVSDGVLIWRGVFDITQSSLFENILQVSPFLKHGGKWLTSEELAEVGMEEALKTFPGLREDKK